MLRCVSSTPLDKPVVPEENGKATMAAGSAGVSSGRGSPNQAVSGDAPAHSPMTANSWTSVPTAAACARASIDGMVMTRRARVLSS